LHQVGTSRHQFQYCPPVYNYVFKDVFIFHASLPIWMH